MSGVTMNVQQEASREMRVLFSAIVLLGAVGLQPAGCQVTAVSPKDFAVMAWGDSPSDPDPLRGMKEAGLNISGFCNAEDLEKVRAAGLTCFMRNGSGRCPYTPQPSSRCRNS